MIDIFADIKNSRSCRDKERIRIKIVMSLEPRVSLDKDIDLPESK